MLRPHICPFLLLSLLSLLLEWTMVSCSPDLGNYDYVSLNDVEIQMPESMTAVLHESLDVVPHLSASTFDASAYTYEWMAYPEDNSTPFLLSEERDLHVTVKLPTGPYTLVYTVKEKEGGFFYRSKARLQVNTPFSEGWLVLCDDQGRARLDMYSQVKGQLYTDILPDDICQLRGPLHLYYINQRSTSESPFYLLTEDGTTRLSSNDFAWKEEYRVAYEMGAEEDRAVRPSCLAVNGAGKVMVDQEGGVYYCNNIMGDGLYNQKRRNSFKVAPFVGCDVLGSHFVPVFMLYNETTKNFVACAEMFSTTDLLGSSTPSDVSLKYLYTLYGFPYANYSLFTIPDRTYDLRWMENTTYDPLNMGIGTTYAVMQNASSTMLYGFALGDMMGLHYEKYSNTVTNILQRSLTSCTDIRKATHFAFSSLKNMMYYAVGNKVWRVGLTDDSPASQLDIELPEGEEVTCMKFYHHTQAPNASKSYHLLVCSKDASGQGILRVYDGWHTEGVFQGQEPMQTLKGFATIKDVIYREIITDYEL